MHFTFQPAMTVAPNDLVGKLIAAYKTDVYFRKKSNTISLRYPKDFGGKQDQTVVPNHDTFNALSSGTSMTPHMLVTWVSKEPLRLYGDTLTGTTYTKTVLTTLPTVLAVK